VGVIPELPGGWPALQAEPEKNYYRELAAFLEREYAERTVFPPAPRIFEALRLTTFRSVRVVLLGQDPYHQPGQAHGLAFSVQRGVTPPPSLRNLFRELHDDVGATIPDHGHLARWARRGVLLLNTVLTVREGKPGSHAGRGWERFTDAVIDRVNDRRSRVVFLLLGAHAQKKAERIDTRRHAVLEAPHPSPLSARRGFFGSRVFSRANALLLEAGRKGIDWELENGSTRSTQPSEG
jgi:uracil-DNA glycosylase